MPRRRTLFPLTIFLSLTTAVALFAAGWVVASPAIADPGSAETESTVRAFYAAANETIRTGDTTLLEPLLAADVEIQGSLAALAPDRNGLVGYLRNLHETNQELALTVESVNATGNRAFVEVSPNGDSADPFVGYSMQRQSPWGSADTFEVDHHQIRAFATNIANVIMFERVSSAPLEGAQKKVGIVTVDRLSLPKLSTYKTGGDAAYRWLMLATGSATVTPYADQSQWARSSAPSNMGEASGVDIPLSINELFALAAESRVEIRNDGQEAAQILMLSVSSPSVTPVRTANSDSNTPPEPNSNLCPPPMAPLEESDFLDCVALTNLASSVQTTLPIADPIITIDHVDLAPQAAINDVETVGPQVIVVNSGQLGLVASEHLMMIHTETDHYGSSGILASGDCAFLSLDSVVGLSSFSEEPVDLTIISIIPKPADSGVPEHAQAPK